MLRLMTVAERHMADTLQIGTLSRASGEDGWGSNPDRGTWSWDDVSTVKCFCVL